MSKCNHSGFGMDPKSSDRGIFETWRQKGEGLVEAEIGVLPQTSNTQGSPEAGRNLP